MAFIITRDILTPQVNAVLSEGNQVTDATGWISPSDTSEAVKRRLTGGAGETFRLLDDDDEVYYEGRYIDTLGVGDVDELSLDGDLGPWAWSRGEGTTQIQYLRDGAWVGLI